MTTDSTAQSLEIELALSVHINAQPPFNRILKTAHQKHLSTSEE